MDLLGELSKELDTVRNLRKLSIKYDPDRCKGVWQCYNVCPVGCWTPNYETRIVTFHDPELCIACGACVLQCPQNAMELTTDPQGSDGDSKA